MEKTKLNLKPELKGFAMAFTLLVILFIVLIVTGNGRIKDTSNLSSTALSSTSFFDTSETTAINSPTNFLLNTEQTSSAISLVWVDNSDNEDAFNIERKLTTETDDGYQMLESQLLDPDTNSYLDITAEYGKYYDYRIQACSFTLGCSEFVYLREVTISTSGNNGVANDTAGLVDTSLKINTIIPPKTSHSGTSSGSSATTTSSSSDIPTTINTVISSDETPVPTSEKITDATKNTSSSNVSTDDSTTSGAKTVSLVDNQIKENTPTTTKVEEDIISQVPQAIEISKFEITDILNVISNKIENTETEPVTEETIDLVYKDTNNDGVSDYDSIYVYNLDPIKPSPTSTIEGKTLSAAEKILLGLDPTKSEIVKIEKEEPIVSQAPVVESYKIEEINYDEDKAVVIKGKALPNSFITIYIYSTPIMVTLKTDDKGEWQYTLDKELADGDHSIYTATVNNAGNIVAKSNGYLFTKTAQAVTLLNLPVTEVSVTAGEPSLLQGKNLIALIGVSLTLILGILVMVGVLTKKNNPEQK